MASKHRRRSLGQVLLGDECVDAVALRALWEQHPFGTSRQTQTSDVCEDHRPRVGEREWKSQEQEEIKRLRAQVELLRRNREES